MSAAATEAPRVTDPSAVMSGMLKIRKLTYTPSATNARISPSVKAPISRVMLSSSLSYRPQWAGPTCAAQQLRFSHAFNGARIRYKMQHGAGCGVCKDAGDSFCEGQLAALDRPIW